MVLGHLSIAKRIAVILYNAPETVFTVDLFQTRLPGTKRNTILQWLGRFNREKGFVEIVTPEHGKKGYRCSDTARALAYIENKYYEYFEDLTPRSPPSVLASTDIKHRPCYWFVMPKDAFDKLGRMGERVKNGSSPLFFRLNNENFSLRGYPPNRKCCIFLKGDWKPDLLRVFGLETTEAVGESVKAGGHVGIAKDLPWEELYSRSIQVVDGNGDIALYRVARSQKKNGEIDIHRKEQHELAKQFEDWWDDKHFKADMLVSLKRNEAFQKKVSETFQLFSQKFEHQDLAQAQANENFLKITEAMNRMADSQRALTEASNKLIDSLNGLMNGRKPDDQPYEKKAPDPHDHSYG